MLCMKNCNFGNKVSWLLNQLRKKKSEMTLQNELVIQRNRKTILEIKVQMWRKKKSVKKFIGKVQKISH